MVRSIINLDPLQTAYYTETALAAATKALENNKRSVRSMIEGLEEISYVSTVLLKQKDAELMTFFNINTPKDLIRAETALSKNTCTQELQVTRNKKIENITEKIFDNIESFTGK